MDKPMQVFGGIWMGRDADTAISDVRITLLEKIGESGSITRAAKAVGISYKTAWDAVDVMNNLSGDSLVASATGGKGGGTSLTAAGMKLVSTYRMIQKEHERFLNSVRSGIEDFDNFYPIIRRLSMKSSARNQFFGKVARMTRGKDSSDVVLVLAGGNTISAIVSNESSDQLGLREGLEACAMFHASSILLGMPG